MLLYVLQGGVHFNLHKKVRPSFYSSYCACTYLQEPFFHLLYNDSNMIDYIH